MTRDNPLTWTRTEKGPGYREEIEHFSHRDGRSIRVHGTRMGSDGHEDGSPYPAVEFDSFEVLDGEDWRDPTDYESGELTSDISHALHHQLDWST